MHTRERYFANAHGFDRDAVLQVIAKAIETELRRADISCIVFVANSLNNDGWLEEVFGSDGVKSLRAGSASLPKSLVKAKFECLNNYRTHANEILITLGVHSDKILLLDDNIGIRALIALPWAHDDVEKWARVTGAVSIADNIAANFYEDPECVVIEALTDLTESINMATGLQHSSDNNLAKTYLRALHQYNLPA